MFKPDKILKRKYAEFNKEYFDGALPHDTMVGWDDELNDSLFGLTMCLEEDSLTKVKIFSVHIATDIKKNRCQVFMTLLHEMAHCKLYPYMKHGKKFQDEMNRLAGRGAFRNYW